MEPDRYCDPFDPTADQGAAQATWAVSALLAADPDRVALKDRNLTYRAASAAFCDWLRRPVEAIVGLTDHALFSEAAAERNHRGEVQAMATGQPQTWWEAGESECWQVTATPLRDGLVVRRREVSGLHQAERLARQREWLFETCLDGVVIHQGDVVVEGNASAAELFGYPRGALAGLTWPELVTELPGSRGQEGSGAVAYEAQGQRSDGSLLALRVREVNAAADGTRLSVLRDITQLRRLEANWRREAELRCALTELCRRQADQPHDEALPLLLLEHALRLTDSPLAVAGSSEPDRCVLLGPAITGVLFDDELAAGLTQAREMFDGLWGAAQAAGQPLLLNQLDDAPHLGRADTGPLAIRRFLAVPVCVGDEVAGELAVANAERDYTSADRTALEQLAAAFAAHLAGLRQQRQTAASDAGGAPPRVEAAMHGVLTSLLLDLRDPLRVCRLRLQAAAAGDEPAAEALLRVETWLEASRLELNIEQHNPERFGLRTLCAETAKQASWAGDQVAWHVDDALPDELVGDRRRLQMLLAVLLRAALVQTVEPPRLEVLPAGPETAGLEVRFLVRHQPCEALSERWRGPGWDEPPDGGRLIGRDLACARALVAALGGRYGAADDAVWCQLPFHRPTA